MKKLLILLALPVFFVANAQQWTFQGGKQTNNGSVSVKSVSGAASQTATQNPTGAAAKVNQTAVTQPPTVVMQATARLPVVVEGSGCNSAIDQVGIRSDLAILFGCQGGVWVRTNNTPTVTEGSGCSGYDKIGVTSGNAKTVTCQGAVWKMPAGVGGTGVRGVWGPLAGKTISCSGSGSGSWVQTAYGYVDASGTPYVRFANPSYLYDTGWVQTTNLKNRSGNDAQFYDIDLTLGAPGLFFYTTDTASPPTRREICRASWPLD